MEREICILPIKSIIDVLVIDKSNDGNSVLPV